VRLVERRRGDVDHPSVDIHEPSSWLSIDGDGGLEPIQKWNLRRLQLVTRLLELEPFDVVDLREGLETPRPGRPFGLVGVADRGCGVEASTRRPRQDELARLLPDRTELNERGVVELVAGLLRELSASGSVALAVMWSWR